MKETIANYELAKLAKEKGFNFETFYFYDNENKLMNIDIRNDYFQLINGDDLLMEYFEGFYDWNELNYDNNVSLMNNGDEDRRYYHIKCSAPSLYLVQKWLRDKYKIFVSVDCYVYGQPERFSGIVSGYDINGNFKGSLLEGFTVYDSYEEAFEETLYESLRELI